MAVRLLIWQYQRLKLPPPPMSELEARGAGVVDEAHRIARKRGRNVASIIKELVGELTKK
jgi:hypothetical protein